MDLNYTSELQHSIVSYSQSCLGYVNYSCLQTLFVTVGGNIILGLL